MSNNTVVIEAKVASFRNLPTTIPIKDSVVIFWESHTKNPEDKGKIQSTINLISRKFDMKTCEKYEVRTGYLSRYNYLTKPKENCSIEELEEAIVKGEEEVVEWIKRCEPNLENFTQINWQECVSKIKNPYFTSCRELLIKTINEDESFSKVYKESAHSYAIKRRTNGKNMFSYLVEENAWILTLPYLYPNKQIYVTHVGNVTEATTILFSTFDYLSQSVRLLFPCFSTQKFANIADFKTEYESKHNRGYLVEDKNFMNVVANVKEDRELSKKDLLDLLITERAKTELLTNIIAKMPGHVYWMNNKYVYMGCNDIQAKDLGLNSRDEIVGKTAFDFLSATEAKKHTNIHKLVIEKCKLYSGEEEASMHNGFRIYMSHKIPLTNSVGKIIGLLGISIDITDRKKAEKLEKELYEIAKKVAHDISSPIASLDIFKYLYAKQLPHDQREILELIIKGIKNITQTLLSKYKSVQNKEKFEVKKISEDYIAPYTINDIIERKRYECYNKALQIKYNPDKDNKLVFIRGDFSNFMRMITNLINNAESAVEEKGKDGIVKVSYKVIGKEVDIRVTDNGAGMPKDMVEKINNGMAVGTTKEDGYGIGMEQILSTVEEMKCKMEVKSKEGEGTEFKLICDICEPPKWFAEKIEIRKGSVVVVLDDDVVIHDIWKKKLKEYKKEIEVKYFRKGSGAIKYINSIKEKKNVLLLTDYELGDEELINGINVIEKTNLKDSHVLVTSSYLSEIKEFEEKSDFLKTCSKAYLNDIPLVLVR